VVGSLSLRYSILSGALLFSLLVPGPVLAAVAPVGQLPSVTVSVTPSIYALPILLAEDEGEWKDFGIQISLKVHPGGEEQLDRISANGWDVAVMDPLHAVKGGNEGDLAIIGVAGNFSGQLHLVFRKGFRIPEGFSLKENLNEKKIVCSSSSAEHFWLASLLKQEGGDAAKIQFITAKEDAEKAFSGGKGDLAVLRSPQVLAFAGAGMPTFSDRRVFLPACLVATSNYADTRKTLVMRWAEGYSRGIRLIQKNPARAASRLQRFYREKINLEISPDILEKEIRHSFLFEDEARDRALLNFKGDAGIGEPSAKTLTDYLVQVKTIEKKSDPGEYILTAVTDQISKLRQEAEAQLARTRESIDRARKEGTPVGEFEKKWDEAREQLKDGRGCLTVIGVLSDLQRGSEQKRVATGRLSRFRKIELGVGIALAMYYTGFLVRRRRQKHIMRNNGPGDGGI
jgi:ABC-type nitrate/sulfonate/bicarbonate transport system substrate-binding protein